MQKNQKYRIPMPPHRHQEACHVGTTLNGMRLMEDSQGLVWRRNPLECELIVPYSVTIEWLNNVGRLYDYWCKPGVVKAGDLVLTNGGVARVKAVDTKSRRATKWLEGDRLDSTPIKHWE